MHSATSSEGPRLVRIAVPCAQIRVAIEMHSRMNGAKRRVFQETCSACRPSATEPWAKQETRSVLCHSVVVDSTFEQSEKVAIAVVSLSSCCWPALRGVVYEVIGSKFVLLHVHCTNGWHTAREMTLLRFSLSMWANTMSNSCILATLSHDWDIKHTCTTGYRCGRGVTLCLKCAHSSISDISMPLYVHVLY